MTAGRHLDLRRCLYWLAVGTGIALMTTAITAAAQAKFCGFAYIVGFVGAVLVEGSFALAIARFRHEGGIGALTIALLLTIPAVFCDAPVIFSTIRGGDLTRSEFSSEVSGALIPMAAIQGRIGAAAKTAGDLADYSAEKEHDEATTRGTCNTVKSGAGERDRFRQRDADAFRQDAKALQNFSDRLADAVTRARAIKPATGAGLADAVNNINAAIGDVNAAATDPALASLATNFAARNAHDGATQTDPVDGLRFTCPDTAIAALSATVAKQLDGLPQVNVITSPPDLSAISTTIVQLPARLFTTLRHGFGSKDSLSPLDIGALIISAACQILIFITAINAHPRGIAAGLAVADRQLRAFAHEDFAAIAEICREPDPDISALCRDIERFRQPFAFAHCVVVAHGCDDPALARVAEFMPIFSLNGWANRWPVPQWMACKFVRSRIETQDNSSMAWPTEMLGARLEVFHLRVKALDELQLAARCHKGKSELNAIRDEIAKEDLMIELLERRTRRAEKEEVYRYFYTPNTRKKENSDA